MILLAVVGTVVGCIVLATLLSLTPYARHRRNPGPGASPTTLESRGQFVPIIGNGIERAGFAVTQDAVTRRVWLTRHDWSVVLTPEQADTLSALLWIAAMQADGKRLEGIK